MRKPNSSDCQWYDRAMEIGALSPEKTDANYCGHYLYAGKSGKYGFHSFQDRWDPNRFLVCDFKNGRHTVINEEIV